MDDRFEKKIKVLLPYIIIEAIIFFLMPLFMGHSEGAATYIIQIGIFPLTAIGCSVFYKLKNQSSDIYVCVIAPLFYAISALLYGMWRDSAINVLVYMASYFVCGYLGLLVADVIRKKKSEKAESSVPEPKRPSPARVDVAKTSAEEPPFAFTLPPEISIKPQRMLTGFLKSISGQKSVSYLFIVRITHISRNFNK